MNPCPCGYYDDRNDRCRCTPEQVRRYRGKVSGPLLDRIDVHIEVPDISRDILERQRDDTPESSASVRHRVIRAFRRQLARAGKQNHLLDNKELDLYCRPRTAADRVVAQGRTAVEFIHAGHVPCAARGKDRGGPGGIRNGPGCTPERGDFLPQQ